MAYGSTYIIIIFNLVPSNYNTESSLHIVNLWLHAFDGLHFCGIPGSCRCPHRLVVTPGYRSSLRAAVGMHVACSAHQYPLVLKRGLYETVPHQPLEGSKSCTLLRRRQRDPSRLPGISSHLFYSRNS
jgi:hypothetical protein